MNDIGTVVLALLDTAPAAAVLVAAAWWIDRRLWPEVVVPVVRSMIAHREAQAIMVGELVAALAAQQKVLERIASDIDALRSNSATRS